MHIKTKISDLDHQGRGIGNIEGKILFIPNALPNEEVKCEIIKSKKNYSIGQIKEIIISSNARNNPKCPYFFKCGGCHISHLNYDDQLKFKKNTLVNIIKKYAAIDIIPKIISSEKKLEYRNKITLKIINRKWGYYKEGSHEFIPIEKCLLAKESINNLLKDKDLFNIKNGEIIIKSNYKDELLINIKTKDKININVDLLIKAHKITGIVLNNNNVYGQDFFNERIDNVIYQVGYNNFFQVNEYILTEVFKILNKKEYKKVLDLYCGVGTLGIAIKKNVLYGIEIAENSIQKAIINSTINNQNNEYIVGDSSKIKEIINNIDTIIIDPPRSGISSETMKNILEKKAEEIIYMSCDPMTLTRDINILKKDYKIIEVYLLDMFPQTYHIECLLIMKRSDKV